MTVLKWDDEAVNLCRYANPELVRYRLDIFFGGRSFISCLLVGLLRVICLLYMLSR